MQVIGLEGLKKRFGDSWPKVSERVAELSKFVIEKKLGPGDVFMDLEDIGYVLVFPTLSRKEAEIKCLNISRDIATKLFGVSEDGTQEISVRTVVGEIDGSIGMEDVNLVDAVSGLLEENGDEFIVGGDGSVVKQSDGDKSGTSDVIDFSDFEANQLDTLNFLYRPIWDTNREAIISYKCQSHFGTAHGPTCCDKSQDLTSQSLLELDILVLQSCCQQVLRLQNSGRKLVISCPVHYETLSRSKSWREYVKHCQPIPKQLRKYFVFEVVGIDPGSPQVRIAQILPQLRPYAREIVCLVRSHLDNIEKFHSIGASSIGLDLLDVHVAETDMMEILGSFSQRCQQLGLSSYISNIRSPSLTTIALSAGIRYIDGDAIRPSVANPDKALALDPVAFYGALYSRNT